MRLLGRIGRGNDLQQRRTAVGSDAPRKKEYKLPVKSKRVEDFRPLLESLDARDELNEVFKNRIAKAVQLLDDGVALPKFRQVQDQLRQAILKGHLRAGTRLLHVGAVAAPHPGL